MSNKYTYSVPFTEEELYEDYVNQVMSQAEIARKYGVSQKVVWRALHKMGIPTRKAYKRNQKGPLNSNWQGGRVLDNKRTYKTSYQTQGYMLIRKPEHPNANKSGYVYEHIYVALEKYGLEKLPSGFCVHHINENKLDNRKDNLVLCTNSKHGYYHASLIPLIQKLVDNGVIAFNEEKGYYMKEGDLQ